MTLYTKYRPRTWNEIAAQGHVTSTLLNALERGEVVHALLFAGPRGTGKTTIARILARELGAVGSDIVEIDAASNRGIDEAKRLREDTFFSPVYGKSRVFILDEVHMLTKEASNALLKTLEEPPPNVFFILCTTDPNKLIPTILSRCQRHNFKLIPIDTIVERLKRICASEKLLYDETALDLIASQASGSMRDAESLLDLFGNYGYVGFEKVKDILGLADNQLVCEMVDNLAKEDMRGCLNTVGKVWDSGVNLTEYCHQMVSYLRSLMLMKMNCSELNPLINREDVTRFTVDGLRYAIEVWNDAASNVNKCAIPQVELECAIVDCWNSHITTGKGDF